MADIDVSSFNLPSDNNNYHVKDTKARGINCTMAQYEAWKQAGTLQADVDYYVDDAVSVGLAMQTVINAIYPVGSIYISVVDDTVEKVQARFGGTWESFGAGRTLVGVDPNDTSFDTVEETGGAKSVTLTSAQSGVPSHAHTYTRPTVSSSGAVTNGITGGSHQHFAVSNSEGRTAVNQANYMSVYSISAYTDLPYSLRASSTAPTVCLTSANTHTHNLPNHTHTLTGGGVANNMASDASQAHTNLQPYITTYMYKRTA